MKVTCRSVNHVRCSIPADRNRTTFTVRMFPTSTVGEAEKIRILEALRLIASAQLYPIFPPYVALIDQSAQYLPI